jgi:protein phosphatase
VTDAVKPLETSRPAADLLSALEQAVAQASSTVGGLDEAGPGNGQTGATVTAMLWSGSRLALVHIGDCRVYLLRCGDYLLVVMWHGPVLIQRRLGSR